MKIYVVCVTSKIFNSVASVSSEGYTSLEKAKEFILSRSDKPELYRDWMYEGDNNIYTIHEIEVK